MFKMLTPLAALLLLAGCYSDVYELPANAPELQQSSYVNENNDEDGYCTILYGGREYACYGTINNEFRHSDVRTCVGYTDGDTNERICKLKATDDYLMSKYVNGMMDQPIFFRAIDTIGKNIFTPPYIDSLDYDIWKTESTHERNE
jgi:hypothetical protein